MKFCNAPNCGLPVFGKGYCRNHQYMREDFDRRSIVQRGIDRHKKEQEKKRKAGWFDIEKSDDVEHENKFNRSSLPKEFTPSKEQINDANDVVKEFKLGERGKSEIWDWFLDRREDLTGTCKNCGKPSSKNSDKYFHWSVCHIFDKKNFPSIATHPLNFIELCALGDNCCHGQMDNKQLDLIDMNCFSEIIDKAVALYPFIAPNERRKIPPVLLEYIKNEI